jgi:hypothetical protein
MDDNEKKGPTMNVIQHPAIDIDDLLYFIRHPKTFVLLMSSVLATGQTDLFQSVLDRVPEASLLNLPRQKIVVWASTAIILKDWELMRYILQKFRLEPHLNQSLPKQNAPLLWFLCRHFDDPEMIDIALKIGCKHRNRSHPMKCTPLIAACHRGHTQSALHLLQDPLVPRDYIDWKDSKGCTALRSACRYGHSETVRMLLEKGADPTLADNFNRTPWDMCDLHEEDTDQDGGSEPSSIIMMENKRKCKDILSQYTKAYLLHKLWKMEEGVYCWSLSQNRQISMTRQRKIQKTIQSRSVQTIFQKRTKDVCEEASCSNNIYPSIHFSKSNVLGDVIEHVITGFNEDVFKKLSCFLDLA